MGHIRRFKMSANVFFFKIGSAAKCFRFLNNLQQLQGKIRKTSTGIGNWRYISWKVKIHWLAPKVGNCWHAAKALGALFFFFFTFQVGTFQARLKMHQRAFIFKQALLFWNGEDRRRKLQSKQRAILEISLLKNQWMDKTFTKPSIHPHWRSLEEK